MLVVVVATATATTAAAVAATTAMLINSFPHPAVTGSDLAATLTENKTINVTCWLVYTLYEHELYVHTDL